MAGLNMAGGIDILSPSKFAPATIFSNTFLSSAQDGPVVVVSGHDDNHDRKKKPHRKSRRGCIACKKRKVKVKGALPDAHLPRFPSLEAYPGSSVMNANRAQTASSGRTDASTWCGQESAACFRLLSTNAARRP